MEVRLRGSANSVGSAAIVYGVQIEIEDARLAKLRARGHGNRQNADACRDDIRRKRDGTFYQLHGQRGASLVEVPCGEISEDSPCHGMEIHAMILIEPAILDGDNSMLHGGRDRGERCVGSVMGSQYGMHARRNPIRRLYQARYDQIPDRKQRNDNGSQAPEDDPPEERMSGSTGFSGRGIGSEMTGGAGHGSLLMSCSSLGSYLILTACPDWEPIHESNAVSIECNLCRGNGKAGTEPERGTLLCDRVNSVTFVYSGIYNEQSFSYAEHSWLPGAAAGRRGGVIADTVVRNPAASPTIGGVPRPGLQIVPVRGLPIVAAVLVCLVIAIAGNWLWALDFFHVVGGGLWTGIDLFVGLVIGPILGRLSIQARMEFASKFMPIMLLIMPTLVTVTLASGWQLARHVGDLTVAYPNHWWLVASFIVVGAMAVIALGLLEPANLAVLFELRKPKPNGELIGKLMHRFVYTAGITGVMQLATLIIMTRIATW